MQDGGCNQGRGVVFCYLSPRPPLPLLFSRAQPGTEGHRSPVIVRVVDFGLLARCSEKPGRGAVRDRGGISPRLRYLHMFEHFFFYLLRLCRLGRFLPSAKPPRRQSMPDKVHPPSASASIRHTRRNDDRRNDDWLMTAMKDAWKSRGDPRLVALQIHRWGFLFPLHLAPSCSRSLSPLDSGQPAFHSWKSRLLFLLVLHVCTQSHSITSCVSPSLHL